MQGSRLCAMCGANTTNLEDGSASCPVPVLPGAGPAARYAVVVSFGVYLNGTSLDDIAGKARALGNPKTLETLRLSQKRALSWARAHASQRRCPARMASGHEVVVMLLRWTLAPWTWMVLC